MGCLVRIKALVGLYMGEPRHTWSVVECLKHILIVDFLLSMKKHYSVGFILPFMTS